MKKYVFFIFGLLVLSLGCAKQKYKPGIYTGSGEGKGGEIKVEILISQRNTIAEIRVVEHYDTPGISDEVFELLPKKVIQEQSCEVDVVSGATLTSKGLLEAIEDALRKAE